MAEDAGVKRAEHGDEGVIAPRAASSFLGSWIAFRSQFVRSDRSCCLICGTFGLPNSCRKLLIQIIIYILDTISVFLTHEHAFFV